MYIWSGYVVQGSILNKKRRSSHEFYCIGSSRDSRTLDQCMALPAQKRLKPWNISYHKQKPLARQLKNQSITRLIQWLTFIAILHKVNKCFLHIYHCEAWKLTLSSCIKRPHWHRSCGRLSRCHLHRPLSSTITALYKRYAIHHKYRFRSICHDSKHKSR